MTPSEAIKHLQELANSINLLPDTKQGQAMKMAIRALQEEEHIRKYAEAIAQEVDNADSD